jgi:hypothetical protein
MEKSIRIEETMDYIVKAAAEDLIWIVVGLFWVIAQIAGAAAKKRQPPRPRPAGQPDELPPDDPFADLIRRLSGAEKTEAPRFEEPPDEEEEDEPSFLWDPRPAPVPQAKPDTSRYTRMPEDIEPMQETASIPEADVTPIRQAASIPDPHSTMEELSKKDVRPKMRHFSNRLPSFNLPSIPSMNLTIDVPSYTEAASGRQGIGRELHLKDRKALRRAMLSHIIFSKPKALEREPGLN